MGRLRLPLAALLLAAVLSPAAAGAETRHITDVLLVNLRGRPDPAADTLRLLRTGEALEVLETQPGFLRVRTTQGEEGWVAEQYTTVELPQAVVAARLEEEVSRLRARLRDLEGSRDHAAADLEAARAASASSSAELAAARGQADRAAQELLELRREHEALLEASSRVTEVMAERDRLLDENRRLRESLDALQATQGSRSRAWAIRWFLAGAAVLLVGWVLGAVTPRRKHRFTVG